MDEDTLVRLACEEGLLPWQAEELTWGEAVLTVEARRGRRRVLGQQQALIAWEQAGLTAQAVLAGKLPPVYECFPFWTEEEVRQLRLEQYRSLLEGLAARKGRST